jgi:hypothetical protein
MQTVILFVFLAMDEPEHASQTKLLADLTPAEALCWLHHHKQYRDGFSVYTFLFYSLGGALTVCFCPQGLSGEDFATAAEADLRACHKFNNLQWKRFWKFLQLARKEGIDVALLTEV